MKVATAPLRVAVVGARRVRNGTGPYLAEHAARAGASVAGVIGTTPESAAAAAAGLAARGIQARAATSLAELRAATACDALIVASPSGTHAPWLEAALEAELHVLCEKPLLAGPADDPAALRAGPAAARRLAAAFAARGLVLEEIGQWRHTVPTFWLLYGSKDLSSVRAFRMRLAPAEPGRAGWVDALAHPLSLLQCLAPGPADLEEVDYETRGAEERLQFTFAAGARRLACSVECVPQAAPPRPAEYALDGRLLRRSLQPGYRFRFETGPPLDKFWDSPDPMKIAVRSFLTHVAAVRAGEAAAVDENLLRRQDWLARLLLAHPSWR